MLLNVRQTAQELGVHENTVRNWAKQGILVPEMQLRPEGWLRFSESEVMRVAALLRERIAQWEPGDSG